MNNIFFSIYKGLRNNRPAMIAALVILFGFTLYLSSQITLEENILRMLPSDEKLEKVTTASSRLNFMDKVIFSVSEKNPSTPGKIDQLISITDSLVDKIRTEIPGDYIKEVRYELSSRQVNQMYDYYLNHLPLFLDSSDYQQIDQMITPGQVDQSIKSNFQTLISPAGFAMKDFIKSDPLHFAPIILNKLNQLSIDDNYAVQNNRLFSKDSKHLFFFLTVAYPSSETNKNGELVGQIEHLVNDFKKENPEFQVLYYGSPVVSVGNANRIKNDIVITISAALFLLIILLSSFFRRKTIFLLVFTPALLGGAIAVATLYLFQGVISSISLAIGSILLGITVDYSLHLFTHYISVGNVKKVLQDISIPVLISCLTTVSAFLALLFVSSRALQDLGKFAAISVFSAALISLIILPQALRKKKNENGKLTSDKNSFLIKISSYPLHQNKIVITGILAISILFLFTLRDIGFEGDMDRMNYMSAETTKAEKVFDSISNITLKSLYLVSEGKNMEEALQKIESLQVAIYHLKSDSIVDEASSAMPFLLSRSKQKKRIDTWNNFWTQDKIENLNRNLKSSALRYHFKENTFSQFIHLLKKKYTPVHPDSLFSKQSYFLGEYVKKEEARVTVTAMLKLDEEKKPMVYQELDKYDDILAFDQKLITEKLVSSLKEDFHLLVRYSLIIVFVILLLAFGRIELAIITFIPMIISWLWTLGIMGLFGIEFTIFNIIISTFIFGLGIDYSIFITQGMIQEYKYGTQNLNSYKTSILLSALTTLTGIGVLIFAKHPALKSMALLSIIGISSVIFITYTLSPALFRFFLLRRKAKNKEAYSLFTALKSLIAYSFFSFGAFITTIYGLIVFNLIKIKTRNTKLIFHYLIMCSSKLLFFGMFNIRKRIINPRKENLKKPAVIIANHQSHIDLIAMMMLHPKIIILTNDWVQNNFIYGKLVRIADYYPVSMGYEKLAKKLEPKIREGFSIMVFPEGTRSTNFKIRRFHKGAFYLAEKLNLDILPIVLHGMGHRMKKGDDLVLRDGTIIIKYLQRITPENKHFGEDYSQRAKQIVKYCRKEYQKLIDKQENMKYYKNKLINNYIFKGPVLEWYLRIKLRLENYYEIYNQLVPKSGEIYDIGCGYGFLSHLLKFTSNDRQITGLDYDDEKIRVAKNCNNNIGKIEFISIDVVNYEFNNADTFILNDVLHYLRPEHQEKVITNCVKHLNVNGSIIIREGNKNLQGKHKKTWLSELFSTKIIGFNKTENDTKKLYFLSDEEIKKYAGKKINVEIVDHSRFSSNSLYVLKRTD